MFIKHVKKTKEEEFLLHPNYEIMFIDNKKSPYIIRNKRTKKYINKKYDCYTLCNNKVKKNYLYTHIALASAFPNITPKETVDHIDDDPQNNHITNLIWMDRIKNSRKGQKKSIKNTKEN